MQAKTYNFQIRNVKTDTIKNIGKKIQTGINFTAWQLRIAIYKISHKLHDILELYNALVQV